MSYYILPRTNNTISIVPKTSPTQPNPCISITLYNYYNENKDIIDEMCMNDTILSSNTFSDIIRLTNPYEYIFSKVPGSKFSVSKLKPKSNILYDMIEIMSTLNMTEVFKTGGMKFLHIGRNSEDSQDCIEIVRVGNKEDYSFTFNEINTELHKTVSDNKFDYMFCEIDNELCDNLNLYVLHLIKFFMLLLKNQAVDGNCIIKIDNNFHKPIIDIVYLLSSMYEKVYIIKPNTSNVMTFEKYIVCKRYITDDRKQEHNRTNFYNLYQFLRSFTRNKNIVSLIDEDIPSFFMNKLDDSNIIIGQQQLEALDQVINILKNKNRYDKIEMIKKSNIQKSVAWCEKYKIPCNKFSDKTNIFLPLDDSLLQQSMFNVDFF